MKMDQNQSIENCLSASSINNIQIAMSGIGSGGNFKVQHKIPNTSTMSSILNSSSTTSLAGLSASTHTPTSNNASNSASCESLEGLEINDTYRLMGKRSIGLGK